MRARNDCQYDQALGIPTVHKTGLDFRSGAYSQVELLVQPGKALVPEHRNVLCELAGLGAGDQRLAGRPAVGLLRAPQYGGCVWARACRKKTGGVLKARPSLADISRGLAPGRLCDLWRGPFIPWDLVPSCKIRDYMWVHGWAWWGGGVCDTSQIVHKAV